MGIGCVKHYIIMTNRPKDPGLKVTYYIRKYLEERGAACIICADNETEEQIRLKEGGDTYRSDCMIVLGGDGTMLKAARETGKIVTVEEHSVIGGLGSAVADVCAAKCPCQVVKIGVNDEFGQSGPAADLLKLYGCMF